MRGAEKVREIVLTGGDAPTSRWRRPRSPSANNDVRFAAVVVSVGQKMSSPSSGKSVVAVKSKNCAVTGALLIVKVLVKVRARVVLMQEVIVMVQFWRTF